MIQKVDTLLKDYLENELNDSSNIVNDTLLDFSFKVPNRDWINSDGFSSSQNWINIYLFEIRENLELRREGWQRSRNGDIVKSKKNPYFVDLYYLITFYNKSRNSTIEHQYLESSLLALFDFSNLAPNHIGDKELLEQITIELFPKPYVDEQLGFQLWNSLDQDARPYISLKITVPLESKVSQRDTIVKSKEITYIEKE